MIVQRFLALACAAGPGIAAADCPTPADLESGVRFQYESGEYEIHYADRFDRTRVVWSDEGSVFTDILSPSGLTLAYWDGDGATGDEVVRRVYDDPLVKRPPVPGLTAELDVMEFSGGFSPTPMKVSVRWDNKFVVETLGSCRTDRLNGQVEILYDGDSAPFVLAVAHLPALGVTLHVGGGDVGDVEIDGVVAGLQLLDAKTE